MWFERIIILLLSAVCIYLIYKIHLWSKYINQVNKAYKEFYETNRYLSKIDLKEWINKWIYLQNIYNNKINYEILYKEIGKKINKILKIFKNKDEETSLRNKVFIEKELITYKEFFDTIENNPLTLEQRVAVITDEVNNLIIAGAGTGKTATLIAKAAYIAKKGLANPNEVLILSFNKSVRKEIQDRLQNRTGQKFQVATFHSMGLRIIGEVDGEKPAVSKLSRDKFKLIKWVENQLNLQSVNKENTQLTDFMPGVRARNYFSKILGKFMAYHYYPYKSVFEFQNLGDYWRYLKDYDITSLNGEIVKSYEENKIANYLFVNGIKYEYEPDYKFNIKNQNYSKYQPDFYLLDYDIYIEHFGINRYGETAPYIDYKDYIKRIDWKRMTHKHYDTKLIETYSCQMAEGNLLDLLEKKLSDLNVEFNPIPDKIIFDAINESRCLNTFAILLSKFLNLYKAGKYDITNLKNLASEMQNSERYLTFLEIFEPIYKAYEKQLKDENRIDFDDMINRATSHVEEGRYLNRFKYVLVDEFQDISQSRYRFLKSLLKGRNIKSFCVGDDWQAIYRFTGGDVSVMTRFKDYFEPCEYLYLNKTFRFDYQLCELSSKFIMKNNAQLTKQLTSDRNELLSPITIKWIGNDGFRTALEECLKEIYTKEKLTEEETIRKVTVLLLGRYRNNKPDFLDELNIQFPQLDVSFSTAHKAKGTESDYIIILNVVSGKYGFPCLIEDDPIINLLLVERDQWPNAEERRLFYVAITRAKKHIYLLSNERSSSIFINELMTDDYNVQLTNSLETTKDLCNKCGTGRIIKRHGSQGIFYSCNNWPYCTNNFELCPVCKNGYIYIENKHNVCSNSDCKLNKNKNNF